ncbi:replication endonuclease [uncultured Pseudoteredinibacter sp.]|uniref:replication endonuclease n=1 Tax=uncultured Pseudoteredinibacter sp. TaxID=1641701 RepID=UPI00260FF81E|nr:replication endonuclease [uncultured Pseudoteredinibacter sp.]
MKQVTGTQASSSAGNTSQCEAWRERIYQQRPKLAWIWRIKHEELRKKSGYVEANRWLYNQVQQLKLANTGLYCDSNDNEFVDYCEAKAKLTEKQIIEASHLKGKLLTLECLTEFLGEVCSRAGIEFPANLEGEKDPIKAAIRRLVDPIWWRRQIRKNAARQFEAYAHKLGLISQTRQIYCTDLTLQRRTLQKARNRHLLENLEAENSTGQVYTLAELADLSVSNPINRRNELMTRIRGFEEYAKSHTYTQADTGESHAYDGLFLTLTTPSKYHSQATRKTIKSKKLSYPNPKFNGSTPSETNAYLCKLWSKIRAEWKRQNIFPFGFRMAEPHHDGTPHWHMVLFLPKHQVNNAVSIFKHYALQEDGDEVGAQKNRVDVVNIDPMKGSAAGYCAKYVAKNIDGFGVETDSYGKDAIMSAMRIEAWATTWGIRQFQQIGGPSVTVYREARRIDTETDIALDPVAKAVIEAADAGDWQSYTDLMGGAICPRVDRPIRPMIIQREELNKYGETVNYLVGLLSQNREILTRTETWTVRPISKAVQEAGSNRTKPHSTGFQPEANPIIDPITNPVALGDVPTTPPNTTGFATQCPTQSSNTAQPYDNAIEPNESSFSFQDDSSSTWTCVNNCTESPPDKPGGETGIKTQGNGMEVTQ